MKSGDKVDITAGPFRGGHAIVQSIDQEKGLVRVMMRVLGEPAPFTLSIQQVKLAELQTPDTATARETAHGYP